MSTIGNENPPNIGFLFWKTTLAEADQHSLKEEGQSCSLSAASLYLQQHSSSGSSSKKTCSDGKMRKHQDAASTNKHKCGISCAPRHVLKSAPPQREDRLAPAIFSLSVLFFVGDRSRFNPGQGVVAAKITSVAASMHHQRQHQAAAALAAALACSGACVRRRLRAAALARSSAAYIQQRVQRRSNAATLVAPLAAPLAALNFSSSRQAAEACRNEQQASSSMFSSCKTPPTDTEDTLGASLADPKRSESFRRI